MENVTEELAVQSYCFRGFKLLDALLGQIKALGLKRMELCGVHTDFDDEASFAAVIEKCRAAGVQICSIGVQKFKGDQASEEKWFRFCQMAGAKLISATFEIGAVGQALPIAEKLAEKYDIRLGIHNHGGYHWLGNGDILEHTFKHVSQRIGLCMDTAWCLQSGEDPLKWVEKFQHRLYGVHIKDFTFDRAGKWTDVVVGTGNLKLHEFLSAAKAARPANDEPLWTLEYEGDVENPGPKLRDCVSAIAAAVAPGK